MVDGIKKIEGRTSLRLSGGLLARNTVWNLAGAGLPLVVGIVAIPLLIEGLGTERFGVLTLAWMLIGYFSLFDMGLGQALTKLVSEKLGAKEENKIPALSVTALILMGILGLMGGLVLCATAGWVAESLLKIPEGLRAETKITFWLLSATIPFVVTSAGFIGVLQAYQQFPKINAIRIPLGVWNFLGPVLLVSFSPTLPIVTSALVLGRVLSWILYFYFFCHLVRPNGVRSNLSWNYIRPLLRFGGWMTISNIISPIMVYLDRFVIAAVVSLTAVAYYATPHELIYRLAIFPIALVTVLFPAISQLLVEDRDGAAKLFNRGSKYIFAAFFPIILFIVTFSYQGLELWVGSEFATNSSFVLQCLAVGMFFNSLARSALIVVQATGRPDLIAKLHFFEMPIYIFLLWWSLGHFGINGAAIAWTFRVALDAIVLFVLAGKLLPQAVSGILVLGKIGFFALAFFIFGSLLVGTQLKALFFVCLLVGFLLYVWRFILEVPEKQWLKQRLVFKEKF